MSGWQDNGCEACGDDPIAPCSEHMTNAQVRAQLSEWRYTDDQIAAWFARNRPDIQA